MTRHSRLPTFFRPRLALSAALCLCALASPAQAQETSESHHPLAQGIVTWDATANFSVTNGNPNGVWSYGVMDSGFTTFTEFLEARDTGESPGWPGWFDFGLDSAIWFNNTGGTIYGVPVGWITLSPPNNGGVVVLRWIAPEDLSGPVQVIGEFLPGDMGTQTLAIFQGNEKTPESTIWSGIDSGTFNFTFEATGGDILNFANYGNFAYGNTPIRVTILTDGTRIFADGFDGDE